MQKLIILSAFVACASAAVYIQDPNTFQSHDTYLHSPVYPVGVSKSTVTKSSQIVNHGGTSIVHAPVYHEVPVVHELSSAKSTVTKSSQIVNHGGTSIVHAPVYHEVPVVHELSSAKSTVTKSSQIVNHGGTSIVHAPVYHDIPVVHETVHAPVMTLSHVPILSSAKSTVTKSSQVVNHGGSAVLHAPVYHEVGHVYPEVRHSVEYPVQSSFVYSQVYSAVKSGDSAISHHSSTVHKTEPVVGHYPLYSLH